MPLKKKPNGVDEIAIFDEAEILLRNGVWQFRMYLPEEKKYIRRSLRTRVRDSAIDSAKDLFFEIKANQKAGKKQFAKTTKQAVEAYVEARTSEINPNGITVGRVNTIRNHLNHWLDFVHRDKKVNDLQRMDCSQYHIWRSNKRNGKPVAKSTIRNEQATINALMLWLFRNNEVAIDRFVFGKVKVDDIGADTARRRVFENAEQEAIIKAIRRYVKEAEDGLDTSQNRAKLIACLYLEFALLTGLRRGEQLQLKWSCIKWDGAMFLPNLYPSGQHETNIEKRKRMKKGLDREASLDIDEVEGGIWLDYADIHVRWETSKVRTSRDLRLTDIEGLNLMFKYQSVWWKDEFGRAPSPAEFSDTYVFAIKPQRKPSVRSIYYWFNKVMAEADIDNKPKRDLVLGCFRHTYITNLVNKGFDPMQVAEIVGSSDTQIRRVYYHTTEEKRMKNAFPDLDYKDNILFPKN
jgi:integrase